MDVARSLLGAVVWTVILAALVRRFRWSYAPLRASIVAGVLLLALTGVAEWSGDYELRETFYAEGPVLTRAAGGALIAFLFYEWRDRTGRDVYKPLSDRARRLLKRNLYGALFFVALVVGVRACVEHQRAERIDFQLEPASDQAVDSVLGGDR